MPNLVEQADLVKRLTNDQLAAAMQNPTGAIAPFIFAAEAARRQAIQEQFYGGPKESVVDSLTKQLANVPQNIPAPTRSPPMVPPTPEMQGVAALQAQQAVQQMAQPQQMMRGGGMVQRYQVGGKVQPWWQIPDLSDTFSGVTGYLGEKIGDLAEFATTPYSERQAREEASDALPSLDTMTPEELAEFNASVAIPDIPVGGARPVPPKPRARPADLTAPAPGETEDEFRARLEALYAAQEPSDWEKAQRYFAMAEQFLDPSKTTMQSVAGAGQAFAQSAAEQARAQREAELAREKGLLEYDIAKAEELRAERLREEEKKSSGLKAQTDIATGQLADLRRERRDIAERIRDIKTSAMTSGAVDDPEVAAQIKILQDAYTDLGRQISSYERFVSETYGFPLIETADLSNGQILPPRR